METGAGSCRLTRQQQGNLGSRRRLRLVDHLSRGSYDPKSPNQFWEVARSVRDDLADMRTSGGLSAVFGGFDQLISSKPGVQGIAQFELQVCA
jgi:hypothetical protein